VHDDHDEDEEHAPAASHEEKKTEAR